MPFADVNPITRMEDPSLPLSGVRLPSVVSVCRGLELLKAPHEFRARGGSLSNARSAVSKSRQIPATGRNALKRECRSVARITAAALTQVCGEAARGVRNQTANSQIISKVAPERRLQTIDKSCCIKLPALLGVLRATSGSKLSSWPV
jgi:hypothetical protein